MPFDTTNNFIDCAYFWLEVEDFKLAEPLAEARRKLAVNGSALPQRTATEWLMGGGSNKSGALNISSYQSPGFFCAGTMRVGASLGPTTPMRTQLTNATTATTSEPLSCSSDRDEVM